MKKQLIFYGIVIAAVFFLLGWLFRGKSDGMLQDPETQIRIAFEYLQQNDLNSYKESLPQDEIGKRLVKKYGLRFKNCYNNPKHSKSFHWYNVKIEKITYKLKGNTNKAGRFKCDAKIYFVHEEEHFKVSYKDMIYKNGKWYGGVFSNLRNLSLEELDFSGYDDYSEAVSE